MKKKVLLAANISESFQALLKERGYEIIFYTTQIVPFDVSGIITSTQLILDQNFLTQFDNLKWIARLGSGMEIIDTDYCAANNIALASSPAGIANAVGEHCVAMLIALQKNIATSFCQLQNNQWLREPNRGFELAGSTVGIIGYGHTGQAFAKKLASFNCTILAFDKYKTGFEEKHIQEVSLDRLQKESDIVSFHVPSTAETYHYYNHHFIQNCKPHILLNTSRGDVVATDALIQGLKNKTVIGAALDVLENEQFLSDPKSPHWQPVVEILFYNTIITPHIAGYSFEAIEKMSAELMEKLKAAI